MLETFNGSKTTNLRSVTGPSTSEHKSQLLGRVAADFCPLSGKEKKKSKVVTQSANASLYPRIIPHNLMFMQECSSCSLVNIHLSWAKRGHNQCIIRLALALVG